jgi:D-lactate dehydrogenase
MPPPGWAVAPVAVSPQPDRAPDSLASGTPEALRSDLTALLGSDKVLARAIDLIRYATDASPYRLFPKVVVVAQDAEDVRKVLAFAGQRHESVTFPRCRHEPVGQAQGDGILVDVRRHWSGVKVEAGDGVCARAPARSCRAAMRLLFRTDIGSARIRQAHRRAR